jgi:hypothetical protein
MNRSNTKRSLAALALLSVGVLGSACVPLQLRQVGYAATNKVWYHWADQQGREHKLVVCDVQPDGSESNCKESEI